MCLRVRARHHLVSALLLVSASACDHGGADFSTKFASDFAPAHHSVSVLGVYQDGRMSLGSWDVLGPYLARALGPKQCPVGYDTLASSNQDLANAIDEFARDEGPTGNLLTQLAPAAAGDLILVVTYAGKLPQTHATGSAPQGAPVATGMGGGRRHGRGRGSSAAPAGDARDPNELDISASLFSVAQNRPVALVGMQYRGESVEDAMTRFAEQLRESVPDLKCTAWNWSVNIDPKRIHATVEEPRGPAE